MREIEFRAKSKESKEWVYGYLVESDYGNYYITKNLDNFVWIDEATIGQYTGLKDKNGTKIFEGDIIRLDEEFRKSISRGDAKTEKDLVRKDCLVGFKEGAFMFCRNKYVIDNYDSYLWLSNTYCEVIGNIYDESNVK